MKNLMAMMILMSLLSVSCNKSGGSSDDGSTQVTAPVTDDSGSDSNTDNDTTAPPPTSNLPALALSFGTNVDLMNLTTTQATKYNKAVALVKKVVATEKFRTSILNHTYNGSKTFANNNGLTNAQIYQSILDAAEKLTPAKNNTMDLGVKFYYQANTVVGWTNSSITYINVNTKYFNIYEINEVAGNLFHEWLHKLGYGHDSSSTTRRPYSVPYAVGYLIRDIGKSFL